MRLRALHANSPNQAMWFLWLEKGHEDYQEIKGVKHHYDDREGVAGNFQRRKKTII
jgi:UDP-N-acetylmuramyl tripeptide synthase